MREDVVLITGANGEIGHGLINHLFTENIKIVALDVAPLDKCLKWRLTSSGIYLTKCCLEGW